MCALKLSKSINQCPSVKNLTDIHVTTLMGDLITIKQKFWVFLKIFSFSLFLLFSSLLLRRPFNGVLLFSGEHCRVFFLSIYLFLAAGTCYPKPHPRTSSSTLLPPPAALVMTAIMAAVAAASTAFSTLHLSEPAITLTSTSHRHLCTLISSSLSSTPTTTEFNITFAPSKPKPEPEPSKTETSNSDPDPENELGEQLYIPWIVRDENGNLTLQSTLPASLLHEMANSHALSPPTRSQDNPFLLSSFFRG